MAENAFLCGEDDNDIRQHGRSHHNDWFLSNDSNFNKRVAQLGHNKPLSQRKMTKTYPPYKIVVELSGEADHVIQLSQIISEIAKLDDRLEAKITSMMCIGCHINLKPEELWFSSKDGMHRCYQCANIPKSPK